SVASLAVGWFFFDSLSFAQVTFLLFILLAIGSSVLALRRQPQEEGLPARGGALSRVPAWASRVGR
ncbi:MAG: hypothetical protein ACXVZP_06955, partial [Gaiellaceae bacterium]